jgi:hypothetical protein
VTATEHDSMVARFYTDRTPALNRVYRADEWGPEHTTTKSNDRKLARKVVSWTSLFVIRSW